MEIRVNGKHVATVEGFTRSVSIRNTRGGEITNFSTAPDIHGIDIRTEQKLPANAPRLDEVEALEHIAASEAGLYSRPEGQEDEVPQAESNTEPVSDSPVLFGNNEPDEEDEDEEDENS